MSLSLRDERDPGLDPMRQRDLRELRIRAGLSQTELAEKIGVTQSLISFWERGKGVPTTAQSESLRRVLGYDADVSEGVSGSPLAAWLTRRRLTLNMSVPELASKSGLTAPAIYRIESGGTRNLRKSSRRKLEKVLGSMPEDTAHEVTQEATIAGIGTLEDFDPHNEKERPAQPGIYVLYDISDRPIYVGEAGNVKRRLRDHEDKFWFKRPIVESASWINVTDAALRHQIETILIKFLKSGAVINKQYVER